MNMTRSTGNFLMFGSGLVRLGMLVAERTGSRT